MTETANVPPPPWRCDVDAVVWWQRAGRVGGLVRYRDSRVGPYDELFAVMPMLRGVLPAATVAFMAVDSEASLVAGRRNWALPKEPAEFTGEPGRPGRVEASGDRWALAVTTSVRGPAVRVRAPGWCTQVWPDGRMGTFAARLRGRARLGMVEVEQLREPPADDAARLLRPGRHPAVVASGELVVGLPAF